MQRKQVQFTDRQVAAIQREAARRRVSDATVVRDAVDRLLFDRRKSRDEDTWSRALSVVGRFRSGRRDIARQHDRELADAYRS